LRFEQAADASRDDAMATKRKTRTAKTTGPHKIKVKGITIRAKSQ
jgi:hypothetical protein